MSKLYYIYFLLILIIIYIIYFNKEYDHFTQENLTILPPPICVNNYNFRKVGEYKLGFINTRADYNSYKPEYSNDGWIFTADKQNWSNVINGQRNEGYGHIFMTKLDLNKINVLNIVSQYGLDNNISLTYPNRNNVWLNYYLKSKNTSINSSIIFKKCNLLYPGSTYGDSSRITFFIGEYLNNNQPQLGLVDMIGPITGVPILNNTYELYIGLTTDICNSSIII